MKAVIVKSFVRIHLANLVNCGIVPLMLENLADYDSIQQGDELSLQIGDLPGDATLTNVTKNKTVNLKHTRSALDSQILKAGGKLAWVRTQI